MEAAVIGEAPAGLLAAEVLAQGGAGVTVFDAMPVSQDIATALRLILVTAARPGMVRGMVGSELRDLRGPSEHGPHRSLPAERMKAGSAFITPLSGLGAGTLRPHLKADPAAPIFRLHRDDLHETAKRLVAGLAMERWTPHGLRRTAATILDQAGYSLEQIGALLAHTGKGVTAADARWDKRSRCELRAAR